MREEGYVFDPEQVGRLMQAFDLTLERLRVDAADHVVKKRLARTLMKIAKRRAEDASPEDLSSELVHQACIDSAPPDRSAWLNTVRSTPSPTSVPWHLIKAYRFRRGDKHPG